MSKWYSEKKEGITMLGSVVGPKVRESPNSDGSYSVEFDKVQYGADSFLSLSPSTEYDASREGIYQVSFSLDIEGKDKIKVMIVVGDYIYSYRGHRDSTYSSTINIPLIGDVPSRSIGMRVSSRVGMTGVLQISRVASGVISGVELRPNV